MREGQPHAVVAGAGIGGLASALALAIAGWRVSIFERADILEEVGAGLQLAPNATRILGRLGVLERLQSSALAPEALRIRRGRDGRLLALVPLGEMAVKRWGAPSLAIHRMDLQRALVETLARKASISLQLGATVADFRSTPEDVTVAIKREESEMTSAADLLVGADGYRSALRARLTGRPADGLPQGRRTAWRASVPAADLPSRHRAPEINLWLGPHAHLVHYPLRGGSLINVVAITDDAGDATRALDQKFANWTSLARELIGAAKEWRKWPLYDESVPARWSEGRVALLGDAAHPMVPYLAQGAAQAIEDADALARALSATPEDVPAALKAYERARRMRAVGIQRQSRRQGWIYHLAGVPALVRDLAIRALGPERLIARYDWIYRQST